MSAVCATMYFLNKVRKITGRQVVRGVERCISRRDCRPMMGGEGSPLDSVGYGAKKDSSQVTSKIDDVLAISKGFGEESNVEYGICARVFAVVGRLRYKKKTLFFYYRGGCK